MAIKHARDNVRRRVLAPAVLDRYRGLVETLEPRIEEVLRDESNEKEVRRVETATTRPRKRQHSSPTRLRVRPPRCDARPPPPSATLRNQIARVETDLQRATNLLTHKKEIAARPARTWFQTPMEKQTSKGGRGDQAISVRAVSPWHVRAWGLTARILAPAGAGRGRRGIGQKAPC